ncbi:uncharacterized protein [Dendropsophus ebraccatus]|uniref:uncharacterized protein n=1 Tax=Dendropsophus ebraccatus TaxID=150705 RepID=UPI003831E416
MTTTYSRMGINVTRLISLVEGCPCLWDLTHPRYNDRHLKHDEWTRIIRSLYPELDTLQPRLQKQISRDVRNRWRSVRDQFRRHDNDQGRSGTSPSRRQFVHYDQMLFLRMGRELRETEGNIAPTETEVEDVQLTSSGSASEAAVSNEAIAGPSTFSTPTGSQPLERGSRFSRSHASRARSTSRQSLPRAVERETLELIQRVEKEDHWDQIGSSLAARIRQMPTHRQWVCVPAILEMMTFYESPHPIPENGEIIIGLKKIFCPNLTPSGYHYPHFYHHPPNTSIPHSGHRAPTDILPHRVESEEESLLRSGVSSQQSFLSLLNTPPSTSTPLTQNTYSTTSTEVAHRQATNDTQEHFPHL